MSEMMLRIELLPGPSDAQANSSQSTSDLQDVVNQLRAQGVDASGLIVSLNAVAATGPDHSPLYIAVSSAAALAAPVIVAWLHGRHGRKVKLKVGDTEIEASTAKEVENLLKVAGQYKRGSESNP
jgi:hypothetical protein